MMDSSKGRIRWFGPRVRRRVALLAVVVLLVAAGGFWWRRRAPALYRVTILPSLGGRYTRPLAINDRGQVIGYSETAAGESHAFLWDRAHGIEDLGDLGSGRDINNAGWIAGTIRDSDECQQAYIRDPNGTLHFLGDLGGGTSTAVALNNRNQVTGTSVDANGLRHAFIWDQANGIRSIVPLAGKDDRVEAINDAGLVFGYADTPVQPVQRFLWDPNDGMVAIDVMLGSSTVTLHNRVCLLGQHRIYAKGYFMVLWRKQTGIEKLFRLEGGAGPPVLINDASQVAYTEYLPSRWERFGGPFSRDRERRVLWDPKRGKIELDRYLPWRLRKSFWAWDMNNQGCIVGYAVKGKKTVLGVVLEPIPEKWEK